MSVRITRIALAAGFVAILVAAFLQFRSNLPSVAYEVGRAELRSEKLLELSQAVQQYESQQDILQPAICLKECKNCYSWRVAIAPLLRYIREGKRYRCDEPWDSEYNRQFAVDCLRGVFDGIFHLGALDADRLYSDYAMITYNDGESFYSEKSLRIVELPNLSLEVTQCETLTAEDLITHILDGDACESGEEYILGLRYDGTISRLNITPTATQRDVQEFVYGRQMP
jgi:hypothetical protein